MSSPRETPTPAAVIAEVQARWGQPCAGCADALLGQEVVLSLVLGFRDAPRCATCLAGLHAQPPATFLRRGYETVRRLACYRAGWEHADARLARAGAWPEARLPAALRMDADAAPADDGAAAPEPPPTAALACAAELDAGDRGCGELVLELRVRMRDLRPGDVLRLVARDPGAPEDLPAWCRLTGHRLRAAGHPVYWIERRPE